MSETLFDADTTRSAVISPCGLYRYELRREWAEGPAVNFLMLNPSKADGAEDDPTVRKCIGFARRWGYGGIIVTNLYAWRSTESKGIGKRAEHVGPDNDAFILNAAMSRLVVCAWGPKPGIAGRVRDVTAMIRKFGGHPHRIGTPAKDGSPCHPLFLNYQRQLEPIISA